MPFKRKYSDEELTKAVRLILDQNMSLTEVSKITGINLRTLQRHRRKYVDDLEEEKQEKKPDFPAVFKGDALATSTNVQKQLDATMLARTKFLDEVFDAKQVILARIKKISKKSTNLDALQRSLKTLADIETVVLPKEDDVPAAHAQTVNMFNFFNQKLIKEGYEGPELSDADIVNGEGQ